MSEISEQQWTIKRLLEWTDEYFSKSGAGKSRLEAETLLSESLGCARIDLYTRFDEIPASDSLDQFRAWVKRHANGEPVAYLVGFNDFYSLKFKVDENVLIPRAETEHVVVEALERSREFDARPIRILDVGTGSGCIAISLAKHLDECQIAATDLSRKAIQVAEANAESHDVSESIRFFEGDVFDALPNGSGPVHMIVSNPPYIGAQEVETVDAAVRDYEPHVALFSGEYGLEVIEQLIAGAPDRLLPGGYLIFELSPIISDRCRQLIESSNGMTFEKMVKDYSGHDRVLVARKKD